MKETITFPFTEHGTGALEKDHFSPSQKNRLWIRSLTPLSVIINVLFCIVMYCQWQLVEVSLKRHLWRAIFKKSAITAGCCTIFYGTRYKLQFFTGVSQFFYPNETLFQETCIKFYLQTKFLISYANFWQRLYRKFIKSVTRIAQFSAFAELISRTLASPLRVASQSDAMRVSVGVFKY